MNTIEKFKRIDYLAFIANFFNKKIEDIYIWDILYYIDQNLYWNKSVFWNTRDMIGLEKWVMHIFYLFIWKQNKNIESLWDWELGIIYFLIKKNKKI